ncbi:MAG: tRNA (guanine-N(1)-)-methyltransferase [Fimbriimonadaceae bacterium]|nr:tRNA (guanine-N(1)-)-methyltransferase [Fimbriimonadaceae bacterium]
MLQIDFVTLFPEQVLGMLDHSIMHRAIESGKLSLKAVNPRDFTEDRHRTVDDHPFGGGPGMLLKVEPVAKAIESLHLPTGAAVVFTDPTGEVFSQSLARDLARKSRLVLVCGHYEGIDDRARELFATHTLSLGDFVLTGGELPALVIADAVTRLIPGVLGDPDSLEADSHQDGLLTAPQYTRPAEFRGLEVPAPLQSGNHGQIAAWKRKISLQITRERRPDLFAKARLSKDDLNLL